MIEYFLGPTFVVRPHLSKYFFPYWTMQRKYLILILHHRTLYYYPFPIKQIPRDVGLFNHLHHFTFHNFPYKEPYGLNMYYFDIEFEIKFI